MGALSCWIRSILDKLLPPNAKYLKLLNPTSRIYTRMLLRLFPPTCCIAYLHAAFLLSIPPYKELRDEVPTHAIGSHLP